MHMVIYFSLRLVIVTQNNFVGFLARLCSTLTFKRLSRKLKMVMRKPSEFKLTRDLSSCATVLFALTTKVASPDNRQTALTTKSG